MLSGPYLPLFLFEVVVGLGVPFLILAIRPLRRRPGWVAVASAIAIVGIFVHRLNLVLNGLSYATVPYPPGVPIGTAQAAGQTSFALTYFYKPALIEYLVAGGVVCFGALLFTFLVLKLPMREGESGTHTAAAHADDLPVMPHRG